MFGIGGTQASITRQSATSGLLATTREQAGHLAMLLSSIRSAPAPYWLGRRFPSRCEVSLDVHGILELSHAGTR